MTASFAWSPLSESEKEGMRGQSWHEKMPCTPINELAMLHITHCDFSGQAQQGQLVTTIDLAENVLAVFRALWEIAFPIASLRPMAEFGGDDDASMAANNSSCFNARWIRNTRRVSAHSLGKAIDLNPLQNPAIRDSVVRPPQGSAYLDRQNLRPGMITPKSDAMRIFVDAGWKWGGLWKHPVDYHHFYRE